MNRPKGRPNLLLVMIDCMRADFFYKERGPRNTTSLDHILQHGLSFTSFYSVTTTTTPCTATVLTGTYPITHGVRAHVGDRLRPGLKTLGERLQSAGYYTVARMTGPLGPETDISRGFDDYQRRHRKQTVFGRFGQSLLGELRALYQKQQPWFLFLHIWVLHMPLPCRLREGVTHRFPVGSLLWGLQLLDTSLLAEKLRFKLNIRSPLQKLYKRTAYERTLVTLDAAFLARLLEHVNYDNTLLAILGDHGEFVDKETDTVADHIKLERFPSHGFHVYEYLTRVPFVLCGAGVPTPNPTVDVLCSQTDVVPTLLSAVGVDASSDEFDGRDLLSSVHGKTYPQRPIFLEAVGGGHLYEKQYVRAVRLGRWKLAEGPWMPGFEEELYDIEQDPLERRNLREHRSDVVARLKPLLARHFAEDRERPGAQYDDQARMSDQEQAVVEERLRELGYID